MGRYVRDKALAAERGYGSVRQMRRANRRPRRLDELLGLPESVRDARASADAALRIARRERITVEVAARGQKTSRATVAWFFPGSLKPTRRGRTRPMRSDRNVRVRTFISGDERVFLAVAGPGAADRAADANALQWLFMHGRADARQLERLRKLRIGGYQVQADPEILTEVGRRGEFDPDDLYRELTT